MTKIKTLTSLQPLKQCIQYDAQTYDDIKERKLMLVLEVLRYQPSIKNAGLQVSIIDAEHEQHVIIHSPAIYPNNTFDVNNGVAPMRFYIPLIEHLQLLGASQSCFRLAFDETDDVNGIADIKLFLMNR